LIVRSAAKPAASLGLEVNVKLQFSGPARYRTESVAMLCRTAAEVNLRRLLKGPRCASWNLAMEIGTKVLKRQLRAAFEMTDVAEARTYLDSVAIRSSALSKVSMVDVTQKNFKGTWFLPSNIEPGMLILYLHGGGYSFYPRSFYNNLAALLALSSHSKLFSLDYRLSPEYMFPAQLEDAIHAYQWLLKNGADPKTLCVLGDSAGGNLALVLLLSLRDSKLPLPCLAICLSPATDFQGTGAGVPINSEHDWITQEMALRWADWFCTPAARGDPLVSPVNADLTRLPPIYIQAGAFEILLPAIQEFAKRAGQQGANVILETWPEMNHDFQAFGYDVPQSVDALRRIGEIIALQLARSTEQPAAT